jgi:hypothetical protein
MWSGFCDARTPDLPGHEKRETLVGGGMADEIVEDESVTGRAGADPIDDRERDG